MRVIRVGIILGIVLCLMASSSLAASSEVESIRQAIDRRHANWVVAENWIMQLPASERQRLVQGLLPPKGQVLTTADRLDPRDFPNVPTKFDWREMAGEDWMTPVKNQLGCGSCAAFAALGALEAGIRIAYGNPQMEVDLSEQHLFSCAGGDCPTGLYMGDANDYIKEFGVPDEACLPYTAVDDNCGDTCPDWQDRVEKIDTWDLLWQYNNDDEELKLRVMNYPVACYMEVYGDFFGYDGGVYEHVTGSLAGGHFVVVVGWNDDLDCWICKNSWGDSWGENGYFRILRGETYIGTWAMVQHYSPVATPTPNPSPTPGCVHDGDINHSGSITPEDALMAFNIYLGTIPDPTEEERCSADCNANSAVTPEDALCVFMNYVAGSCTCADELTIE